MPHQRFDQARPFATLAVVLLLWALLPLGLKSFTRASFFELQAPFATAQSYVQDLQEFWALRTRPKNEIIEAGRDLARLNAAYELRLQESEQLRAELLRLENILKLPPMPAYRSEPARVARRDFSGWWQRLVIRKGRNHGITVGAPVVYVGGIVGRVTEVYAYTAVVDLITSPTFRVAASAEGDTRPISYQGGLNDSFRTPRGTVEFVPLDIFAAPGQPKRLVTSGLGGVFPPGLTIGEIVVLEPSTDGLFKSGEVRLDSRLGALAEVTVLVPLQPEEL
ncbi:MAG: rod shape-determining protein MreC [Candidatus Didemnitutus sp.]|nr:rod shape-determining protein MreC [Candidatus Didemnitutus sp.]